MDISVRPLLADGVTDDDAFDLILETDALAFDEGASDDMLPNIRARLELDRSFIAWSGQEAVGCTSIFSFELSVPGGKLPVGGVTWVGVKPTHRRRGAMRKLLATAHESMHEAGREPVAALWAAEPSIYGRFGYGLATRGLSVVLERAHGGLSRAPEDPSLRLRMVEPSDDRSETEAVHDTVRSQRPGIPAVTTAWHAFDVLDPKDDRGSNGPLRTVLVEDEQGVRGFVRYRFAHDWKRGYADGTVKVRQLMASDPEAEAALWRYLIDFDLSGRVDAWNLPFDSPMPWWLDEPRHHKQRLHDQLYVRLVDLGPALSGRTYAADVDMVLEVTDNHCAWNTGRWRLSADGSGATCASTGDPPDLTLDVAVLGAAFLGGTALSTLGAAGWIEEHTPGALQRANTAFSHPHAPWSPVTF